MHLLIENYFVSSDFMSLFVRSKRDVLCWCVHTCFCFWIVCWLCMRSLRHTAAQPRPCVFTSSGAAKLGLGEGSETSVHTHSGVFILLILQLLQQTLTSPLCHTLDGLITAAFYITYYNAKSTTAAGSERMHMHKNTFQKISQVAIADCKFL